MQFVSRATVTTLENLLVLWFCFYERISARNEMCLQSIWRWRNKSSQFKKILTRHGKLPNGSAVWPWHTWASNIRDELILENWPLTMRDLFAAPELFIGTIYTIVHQEKECREMCASETWCRNVVEKLKFSKSPESTRVGLLGKVCHLNCEIQRVSSTLNSCLGAQAVPRSVVTAVWG